MQEDRARLAQGIRLAVATLSGSKLDRAARLAISPHTLDRWLAGAAKPTEERLARLARVSGMPQEQIRNGGKLDDALTVGASE